MNHTKIFLSAGLATILFAGATPEVQADALCKDVKFEFKNNHSSKEKIRVTKVEYWDKEDNKWRTETVANKVCSYGLTCQTSGDDLGHVSNEKITKIRFHFQYWAAGKWSGTVVGGEKLTSGMTNNTCAAGKVYRKAPGEPFVITG